MRRGNINARASNPARGNGEGEILMSRSGRAASSLYGAPMRICGKVGK